MKTKTLSVAFVRYALIIVSFALGFMMFVSWNVRFGPRPAAWRLAGANISLRHAITHCFTGNDAERTKFMICAQKYLNGAIEQWGTVSFMRALERKLETKQVGTTQCHDLAHAIGWATILETRNLGAAMTSCTNACVYGCGHGAMAAWYATGHDVLGNLSSMCIEGIDWSKNPQGKQGCFHELGHALTNIAGNNIMTSLTYCDKVDPVGTIDCASGVFMELFEAATFASSPLPLPQNHPDWCGDLRNPYKELCFMQAGVITYGHSVSAVQSIETCLRVPVEFQDGCFGKLGQNIFYVYQHEPDRIDTTLSFCHDMGEEWFMICVEGVINSSVAAEPHVGSGIEFCAALGGEEENQCFSILIAMVKAKRTYSEMDAICMSLPREYRQTCQTV